MANKIKGITIEIQGDTTSFTKALKSLNSETNKTQRELNEVNRLLKLDPKNTELLAQKQKLVSKAIEDTKTKLDALKDAKSKADIDMANGTEVNEEQYRKLQREIITTENKLKSLNDSVKSSNVNWDSVGKKMQDVGNKTTDVGKKMTVGVTVPILAIGAASTKAWMDVDEAMDTIILKTGATGEAATQLEQSFKKLTGELPVDMQVVGEAIGEVNTQFGLMGDELDVASTQVIKFAEITGQDVTSSTINAKQAIEKYNLSAKDLDSVLDSVAKTSQSTGVSTTDLFTKVIEGSPQIQALGLDFAQATQLIGQFEQSGVDSSKALGYLSKAQVVFAKDGKTLEQGLKSTVTAIKNSKNETDALTLASEVFGTKGAVFMVDAIKNGTLELDTLAEASANASGTVATTFDATLDPLDQSKIAMNNLKLAGADLNTSLQTALAPTFIALVQKLQELVKWFGGLSDGTKNTILVVAGLMAAIGPLATIIGVIVKGVGLLVTLIPIILSPIGLVVAAIAAVIAIIVLCIKHWDDIKKVAISVWDAIVNAVKTAVEGIKKAFGVVVQFFKDVWQGIKDIFSGIGNWFKNIFTGAVDNIKSAFSTVKGFIKNIFDGVLSVVKAPLNTIMGFVNKLIGGINTLIAGANKVSFDVPDWVPGIGGKKFGFNIPSIPEIPMLAKGGILSNGQAIVAEAGPELISMINGKTVVQPLSSSSRNTAINGGGENINLTVQVDKFYNNSQQDIRDFANTLSQELNILRNREERAFA